MSPNPTVLLFDIDGTLMTQKGASRRAVKAAFEKVHGRGDTVDTVPFAGRTDPLIFTDALVRLGHDPSEALLEALYEEYLSILPGILQTDPQVSLLPGVREILAALRERPGVERRAIGLGTGNLERGARVKLGHFDIWSAFDFGGYGSDASNRAELLRIGAERGAARLGRPRSGCRVVIIGDTPLDVAAALAIGAECLAVTTGGDSAEVLREAGATRVVDDLTDPAALAWLS